VARAPFRLGAHFFCIHSTHSQKRINKNPSKFNPITLVTLTFVHLLLWTRYARQQTGRNDTSCFIIIVVILYPEWHRKGGVTLNSIIVAATQDAS
jgi:hypothetical protein